MSIKAGKTIFEVHFCTYYLALALKYLKDYPKPLQITLFISKKGTVSRISVEKINEKALIQELENIAFTKLSSFSPATYDTGKPKEDTYTIVLR